MHFEESVIQELTQEYPNADEYLQAAREICADVVDIYHMNTAYKQHRVLERLLRPERVISFKVEWEDDNSELQYTRGWRVQHSQLLGPYKGGLRFHPSVNQSILQFLALEQSIKNALSGEALGAGKGGAVFDPKQHSESEIRRFSQAFIRELSHNIGEDIDVPAGDIGVSSRELAWMNGHLIKINRQFNASLTGKPTALSGSEMREQATGFGVIYLLLEILSDLNEALENKTVAISGAGNGALHAAQKAIDAGATILTLSNSRGTLHAKDGIVFDDIKKLIDGSVEDENPLKALAEASNYEYLDNKKPWQYKADIYIPCATQNEINEDDADAICENTKALVIEGANMPCSDDAIALFRKNEIMHIPGKAANAGGVILSSFEIQQQLSRQYHSIEALDKRLRQAMQDIHKPSLVEIKNSTLAPHHYSVAASRAGFRRICDAMVAAAY